MSDGTTVQTPPETIEAATQQFLSTLTPEQSATPIDFTPRDPNTGRFVSREAAEAMGSAESTEETTEEAKAEETTEPVAEATTEVTTEVTTDEGAEEPKEEPKEETKAESIVIPGLKERGEEDLEVPVEDPVLAERLRRLVNDGMRRKDYNEKMAEVESFKRERAEFEAELEANPVGVLMQYATPERQLEIAQALLVEHWETLFPAIQQYAQDPAQVYKAQRQTLEQTRAAEQEAAVRKEAARREAEVLGALRALVPETADTEAREAFLRDAERDLIDAAMARQVVTRETVPALVKRRLQMYGFVEKPQAKPLVAKRVGQPDSKGVSVEQAKQQQAAIQQKAKTVKAAAALPPAGRGPVATRRPVVDPGADVEQASIALRQKAGQSWADYRS